MKGSKGSACPLSVEPELQEINLTEDDEFLIMGCDGLWDVMSNQCVVTMARKELMIHNDPQRCSRELAREALKLTEAQGSLQQRRTQAEGEKRRTIRFKRAGCAISV
ncbi:hypothetical protein JHK82_018956 [Glycine max]|nr:hypothetical protein JHK85_019395 [Glycine max]KAG5038133.1 hypothetical protein JHK86_018973 [Glycine max]KAG5143261.1 hypothetical protein JHK82_018956 [Glycine max]